MDLLHAICLLYGSSTELSFTNWVSENKHVTVVSHSVYLSNYDFYVSVLYYIKEKENDNAESSETGA